jgi:AAA+ superfamily predicted ATPase
MYVGESQRKMRLALQLVESLAPCVLYIDEIELIVSERSATRHDGGVKSDLMAQLFQFTSRDDLRGKVVLLASSNLGYKLDFALLDRFSAILPILELTAPELTQLFPVIEKRITEKVTLNPNDKLMIESGEILSNKGASPRRIYDIINHASFLGGINHENIRSASISFQGNAKPITTAYTTLTSLSIVTQAEYFPWSQDPMNYKYQWYLEDLVEKATGKLNRDLLEKKTKEYEKHVTH